MSKIMPLRMRAWLVLILAPLSILPAAISPVLGVGLHQPDQNSSEAIARVGVHWWKPGKIYDEAVAGIVDGLAAEDIEIELFHLHSDRDKNLAEENLRKLDSMGLDVIYSLSSAGTQIAKRLNLMTPIIATVVNHPASLGVSQKVASGSTRLSGTSYYIDADKQLSLYENLFPTISSIGMIYDKNNPAGVIAEMPFMRLAAERRQKSFVAAGVSEKAEISEATTKLLEGNVDLIVIPTNRLVYANLERVTELAFARGIPVVSMNKQGVENGALAALFADTYYLGRQTAKIARQIIRENRDPMDIGFEYYREPEIIINLKAAKRIQYQFPAAALGEAAIVIQ